MHVEIGEDESEYETVKPMEGAMMDAEKQKIVSRRQIQALRKLQKLHAVKEPLTSPYMIKKKLAESGYTTEKALQKFKRSDGTDGTGRYRQDGVEGLVKIYFSNIDMYVFRVSEMDIHMNDHNAL